MIRSAKWMNTGRVMEKYHLGKNQVSEQQFTEADENVTLYKRIQGKLRKTALDLRKCCKRYQQKISEMDSSWLQQSEVRKQRSESRISANRWRNEKSLFFRRHSTWIVQRKKIRKQYQWRIDDSIGKIVLWERACFSAVMRIKSVAVLTGFYSKYTGVLSKCVHIR